MKYIKHVFNKPDIDPKELERYNDAIKFRGQYLEAIIDIEHDLDLCISKFFERYSSSNEKQVSIFLNWYLLRQSPISLSFKIKMIQQIVYLEFFKAKRFDHYHNLVLKLNDLRTYVAHYPIGFGFEDGISFYKIEAKYKNPFPSSISESFIGEMKIIELTIKTQREIELQIIIASEYGLNQIKKLER